MDYIVESKSEKQYKELNKDLNILNHFNCNDCKKIIKSSYKDEGKCTVCKNKNKSIFIWVIRKGEIVKLWIKK